MNSNEDKPKIKQPPKLDYVIYQPLPVNVPPSSDEGSKKGFLKPPQSTFAKISPPSQPAYKSFSEELEDKHDKKMESLKKLAKYNPLVPIGCLVTIAVLGNGLFAMKNKDKNNIVILTNIIIN